MKLSWLLIIAISCLSVTARSEPKAKTELWTMTMSYQDDGSSDHDNKTANESDRNIDANTTTARAIATFEVRSESGNYISTRLVKLTGEGSLSIKHQRHMKSVSDQVVHTIEEDFESNGAMDPTKTTDDQCLFSVGKYVLVKCILHFTTNHTDHARETTVVNGATTDDSPHDSKSTSDMQIALVVPMVLATPQMLKDKHWTAKQETTVTDPTRLSLGEAGKTTTTVDIRGAGEPLELILDAPSYDTWVPEANLKTPTTAGNHIPVTATLQTKSGKPVPLDMRANRITFKLKNGSRLPGVATNFPANSTDDAYDLRIAQSDNVPLKVDADELGAVKQGPAESATVNIASFDFGGWSELEVTAELADGTKVTGHLKGKPEGPLALPNRADDSKIAKSWLKSEGGKADDTDDDAKPTGNGFAGDGFTTFEEYRGIVCGGNFTRLHPKTKDLLIFVDPRLRADGATGIGYFQAATKLDVHVCTSEQELPKASREVTSNHGAGAHHIDQHGIVIDLAGAGDAETDNIGTPAIAGHIVIGAAPTTDRARREWDSVFAHEIGHACNLKHHGDGDRTPVFWVKRPDGGLSERATEKNGVGSTVPITLVDEKGTPIPLSDPDLSALFPGVDRQTGRLYISVAGGEHSGDEKCFMRYSFSMGFAGRWVTVIKDRVDPSVRRWIRKDEPIGTKLCSSKKGTTVNAANHKPYRWHDNATAGDCVHSFVVNDAFK